MTTVDSNVYKGNLWTIQSFVSGFSNNAYLLTCKRTNHSIIIDTPDRPNELITAARETEVQAVLITHNHQDHLQGFDDVLGRFPVSVGIGHEDASAISPPAGTIPVGSGNLVTVGDISLRAIATPGHTPGSTCFMLPSEAPGATPHVFTGDTLFPGGPGKSGSPEAFKQLVHSIESNLVTLPDETVVLPGHGASTTILASRREFEQFSRSKRRDDLFGDVTWTGDNS